MRLARLLAGSDGKIAAIDTEHGSLSKYADLFDFDVIELDSYSPDNFQDALTAAERGDYRVFICDSLSHFWMGKDGALEFVDNAKKLAQSKGSGRIDDMAGWKEFRPHERAMVDRMIASPCHVITTLRTKTAYEEQINERTGKKQRVKIGLAPVQREGLEYEFDLVGLMNDENEFIVDKTRCSAYAGRVISKPKPEDFQPFADWLRGAKPAAAAPPPPVLPSNTPPAAPAQPPAEELPGIVQEMYKVMATDKAAGFARVFTGFQDTFIRLQGDVVGVEAYLHILGLHGVDSWQNFKSLKSARQCVLAMYKAVESIAQEQKSAVDDQLSFSSEAA